MKYKNTNVHADATTEVIANDSVTEFAANSVDRDYESPALTVELRAPSGRSSNDLSLIGPLFTNVRVSGTVSDHDRIIRNCRQCGKPFTPSRWSIKNRIGFFCSRQCRSLGPDNKIVFLTVRGRSAIITLTRGLRAIVDVADLPKIGRHRWYAHHAHRDLYYAYRHIQPNNKMVSMHGVVFGAVESGKLIDHRNGNGLDNRRENLRLADSRINVMNIRSRWGTSKYRGVYIRQKTGKCVVQIRDRSRQRYLGTFASEEAAARAYDAAAIELHGEHANLNFPNAAGAFSSPLNYPAEKGGGTK